MTSKRPDAAAINASPLILLSRIARLDLLLVLERRLVVPTPALLDDAAARRCAGSLRIPYTGTAGLVLLAKRRGLIPAASAVLGELIAAGMYMSPAALADLLRAAGG